MKIAKKAVVLVGSIAMMASLAACGNNGDDGSTTSSDGKLSGSITFQTWNLKGSYADYFNDLISAFQKDNPGTKINWVDQPSDGYADKLSADAAAGTLPDIVDMGPNQAYSLAKAGILMNLTKEDPSIKSAFLPSAYDATVFKGSGMDTGSYGFPWYLNSGPTFTNLNVLKKCGISTDSLPETYDQLFALADQMSTSCPGTSVMAKLPTLDNFGEYGVPIMNDDQTAYTFNDAKGVEFVQHYVDMYKNKTLDADALNADWNGETDSFKQNQTAVMIGSLYSIKDFKANSPKVYDGLGLSKRLANASPQIYEEMLAVNAQTKNKPLALAFATYVTNKENQLVFDKQANVFPSVNDSLDDPFFNPTGDTLEAQGMKLAVDAIKTGKSNIPAQFSDATDVPYLREQIALAVSGKQTVKQSLDNAVNEANKGLQQ
jgi:multiple sugar transport system substrate-binding protein